jgi:hypothetical protein
MRTSLRWTADRTFEGDSASYDVCRDPGSVEWRGSQHAHRSDRRRRDRDTLRGGAGSDQLSSATGEDRLTGGAGRDDVLDGGPGDDYVNGRNGADACPRSESAFDCESE